MLYRIMLPLLLAATFLAAGAAAQLPNLTYYYAPNWQYPVLPTTLYCPLSNMVVPPTLPGNTSIYLNDTGINDGTATALDFYTAIYIDGQVITPTWRASLAPGAPWGGCGMTRTVRGGRHTFEVVGDIYDEVIESDETDNAWAHQFVFTPYLLSPSTPVERPAAPYREGGWTSIIDGSPVAYNCDGFRFMSTGWWNAVVMYAVEPESDYDLYLFNPSTGSEDGFIGPIAQSEYFGDNLEAVIVNRNTVGMANYDVGVDEFDGTGNFVIEHVISEPAWVGMSTDVLFADHEFLRIWDTYIPSAGWCTVSVTDSLQTGVEFWVGLLVPSVTEAALWQVSALARSDENGEIRLTRNLSPAGYYGLVIYRNPRDGTQAVDLHLSVEETPPDLVPFPDHMWPGALVPTPVPVSGVTTPAWPDTLHGYVPQTYPNFNVVNQSPSPSPQVYVALYQDGQDYWFIPYLLPAFSGNGHFAVRSQTGYEYPGGRHTLTLEVDHPELIHEIYENNNAYGEQFCWSPLYLSAGGQYSHYYPGNLTGGLWSIDPAEPIFYNCDGYRIESHGTGWAGLVLTQEPTSDYELAVYDPLVGVKDGFDDILAVSVFSNNETDYVLINGNILPAGVHDIGVLSLYGGDNYIVEGVGSTDLPFTGWNHHGPYTMPMTRMLHLYNIYLRPDLYAFRLDNVAGAVDWGFGLHVFEMPHQGRQDAMAAAWLHGPAEPEWFSVVVPVPQWYCLAVFKAGPQGFDLDGTYELTILRGVSDVPDEQDVPTATALCGIHPNPFNPQTTISYELAAAAEVELSIYDLKGARVRRLVGAAMPAGRHAAVWNGKDDAGSRVASGVYLTRFTAGAHREVRKVVMVK